AFRLGRPGKLPVHRGATARELRPRGGDTVRLTPLNQLEHAQGTFPRREGLLVRAPAVRVVEANDLVAVAEGDPRRHTQQPLPVLAPYERLVEGTGVLDGLARQ